MQLVRTSLQSLVTAIQYPNTGLEIAD